MQKFGVENLIVFFSLTTFCLWLTYIFASFFTRKKSFYGPVNGNKTVCKKSSLSCHLAVQSFMSFFPLHIKYDDKPEYPRECSSTPHFYYFANAEFMFFYSGVDLLHFSLSLAKV